MNVYYTHDNGARPFKVVINKKDISVYREYEIDYDKDEYGYEDKPILKFSNVEKIFIGKNPRYYPRILYGEEYEEEDDGNSILLQIKNNKYVFIGEKISQFHSYEKITKFLSPIGNSDVPYPFAIDKDKNYYLMIEDVVFKPKGKTDDPYGDYYYRFFENKKTLEKYNVRDFKSLKILQERLQQ
jgi:hypothetical protein